MTIRPVALLFVLGATTGCVKLELQRNPQPQAERKGVYTEPTGDGSHYIEVVGEPRVPPVAMRGKWRREAERVCEGDYLVLSELASERTRGPFVEGRVYEGWVRCVSPEVDADEAGPDDPPRRTPPPRGLPRLAG